MPQWDSLSVKNVITKIKASEIVLPVIQRRLVWSEDKMELLFDSLLKGNAFGAIICLLEEEGTEPLFAYREFTRDGSNKSSVAVSKLQRTQMFIIDGQQRLQSFYIGLQGTYNGKRMYYDLYSDYQEYEYDFRFAAHPNELPKANKERSGTAPGDCLWYPVEDLFVQLDQTGDMDQVAEEIIGEKNINDDARKKYIEKNIFHFFSGIFDDKRVGVAVVRVNKKKDPTENRQRIVELFRRLNDGGTRLSSYDLVASTLRGFDYKMEGFLDNVVEENSDIGIEQDELVKLLMILQDKPSKDMSDLEAKDAEFAVQHEGHIRQTLKAVKTFLTLTSNYHWFAEAKKKSAIPLFFLVYHIFHSTDDTEALKRVFDKFDTTDKNYRNMRTWLCLSLLNKVFSKGCGWDPGKTGIKKIHEVLSRNKGADFPVAELFNVYTSHPLHHFNTSVTPDEIGRFDRDYVFYLIYGGQPSVRREDIDHIHPSSLLEAQGIDQAKINNIGNFQLLDFGTNRGAKNNKELEDWILNCVDSGNRQGYLSRHLIPEDQALWRSGAFDRFLRARLGMISEKINKIIAA